MKDKVNVATSTFNHTPVLANELIEIIKKLPEDLIKNCLIIDATIGGGGHSSLVLETFPGISVIGLDQDPKAVAAASEHLKIFGDRAKIETTNFSNFTPSKKVAMVFADLGVSSPQLDEGSRGFSFRLNGPLDMRMNQIDGTNAAELIDRLSENELANLIFKYGEERFSRRIAKRIKHDLAKQGPYSGTIALAYAIAGCYPPKLRNRRVHPATKTFQALRIAINHELDVLSVLLKKAPEWLLDDGLFAVISFHSLEDRLVKKSFLTDTRLERITRKPLIATTNEISINPRSRSAKMRVARRIEAIK
ncbi:16S rRNA (cytosine(1402)-N(4))-methyltransferase RsmH [Prochlorococcus marinus]|uniref:Ribosomal RNA small subunit methyltransferase H n=1 Tax=Prochlorococcus marinus (strain MIT 9211) TaxID=93059 RepID=RSMH_PROM4|nr:16S rRNA (cytosine(1402)-N(4))-methyltransferase RsmH [Prochlorococcus marinus]A9BD32.1 RecName: Full=Ribosomal RNA small subunit methyltransferase H; AltName: Full=16S rRNA m(4)C1402 methyltransferase; AltName: Full=rRNA (cytosine-N(4)-)-methyltransferase RsmH [Prochlorococcus marinus str. MIT 9211]ABX08120.1 Predicted S-adenosylmethionine-dependent methyltransferase [Prochlorococcus marinus str. MIT 9211]